MSCSIFRHYRDEGGPATLALMGAKLMPLPDVPWVRYVGMLSEPDRLRALESATVVVVPSPLESLSLLALEGMALGTPVLCNARADVLVDHCRRSNAACSTPIATSSSSAPSCCSRTAPARADGAEWQAYVTTTTLGRDHGEVRHTDRRAAEEHDGRCSCRKLVFVVIFFVSFGIYVMRA